MPGPFERAERGRHACGRLRSSVSAEQNMVRMRPREPKPFGRAERGAHRRSMADPSSEQSRPRRSDQKAEHMRPFRTTFRPTFRPCRTQRARLPHVSHIDPLAFLLYVLLSPAEAHASDLFSQTRFYSLRFARPSSHPRIHMSLFTCALRVASYLSQGRGCVRGCVMHEHGGARGGVVGSKSQRGERRRALR